MKLTLDMKISGMLLETLCTSDDINQFLARLHSSGVLSEMLCTFDYNKQYPLTSCAPSEFKGALGDPLHV